MFRRLGFVFGFCLRWRIRKPIRRLRPGVAKPTIILIQLVSPRIPPYRNYTEPKKVRATCSGTGTGSIVVLPRSIKLHALGHSSCVSGTTIEPGPVPEHVGWTFFGRFCCNFAASHAVDGFAVL